MAMVAVLVVGGSFDSGIAHALTASNADGSSIDCSTGILTSISGATSTASAASFPGCTPNNGSPMFVEQPWGLTTAQSQSLIFSSGSSVSDAAGITFLCPSFYGIYGCYNLTGLDYWKSQARVLAKETNGSGLFAYWLTH